MIVALTSVHLSLILCCLYILSRIWLSSGRKKAYILLHSEVGTYCHHILCHLLLDWRSRVSPDMEFTILKLWISLNIVWEVEVWYDIASCVSKPAVSKKSLFPLKVMTTCCPYFWYLDIALRLKIYLLQKRVDIYCITCLFKKAFSLMVFIFSSQLIIPTIVMCCGGIILLYRYLSSSSRKFGDVERQGQLFLCIISFQFYSSWKHIFPLGPAGQRLRLPREAVLAPSWGVSSPEGAQPWAAPSDLGAEPAAAGLDQGPPELLSSLRCLRPYGMLVLFTFTYCSIPTFLLISDHAPLGKDEFRDKTTFGAARIVYIRKEKSVWNM